METAPPSVPIRRVAPSAAWHAAWTGSVNAFATLAVVLSMALLAGAPAGASAAALGIPAAFAAVVAGGIAYALAGSALSPAGGPSSPTALIIATLLAELVADPQLAVATPAGLQALWAALGVTVALMGVLQAVIGALGLGRLARFVPQPVLAGFMNGVALTILISQVPHLLGLYPGPGGTASFGDVKPLALVVGAATAGTVWIVRATMPRAPAGLLALLLGTALTLLLGVFGGTGDLGPNVGALPHGVVLPQVMVSLFDADVRGLIERHATAIVLTALLLMLVGTLESMLAALATDQMADRRHDTRRELMSLGLANMVSGACGGLPLVLMRARAVLLIDQRATGRGPVLAGSLAFAAMFAFGTPLLAALPRAVLAGIMVTIAVALADRWTQQLLGQLRAGERSADLRVSVAVIALVCAATVTLGFVAGVAAGTVLAMLIVIRNLNRSLVRTQGTAAARPSRRVYMPAQERLLREARQRVVFMELEGSLFFGSAERLQVELDALAAGTRFVVLDLRRVTTIDESGAMVLQSLSNRLGRAGTELLLAGVSIDNRHGRTLRAFGCFRGEPRRDWFADADRAIEAAEQRLLAEAGLGDERAEAPLEACTLFLGLDAAERRAVESRLQRQGLAAGERLFAEGDPGDRLFVLIDGSISIISVANRAVQRFVSYSPGVMLGELAMLDGGGRSADAVADVPSVVLALTRADFDRLSAENPVLGAHLARNIALHLAQRLRSAGAAWQASEA